MGAAAPQKIKKLYAKAGIDHDSASEPLATITWVREFRNDIMHAKPENSDAITLDQNGHAALDPAWMGLATPAACRESFNQVRAFRKLFQEKLGITLA